MTLQVYKYQKNELYNKHCILAMDIPCSECCHPLSPHFNGYFQVNLG